MFELVPPSRGGGHRVTFRLLFVFVVLRHDRRELLHLNVTDQLVEAFPEDTAPTS